MVRRNICQHSHVGSEIKHAVQLKTRQLNHIQGMRVRRNLCRQRKTDVAGQPGVNSRRIQNMLNQQSCRGFAVAAGNAAHFCRTVPSGKFNLRNDLNAPAPQFLNHRIVVGNTRAFDNQTGIIDSVETVTALFKLNLIVGQNFTILVGKASLVRQKNFMSELFGQQARARAALSAAQHNCSHCFRPCSFPH